MREFLRHAFNPREYAAQYASQVDQLSDYEIAKKIDSRRHPLRETALRSGVGLGLTYAGTVISNAISPEASRIAFYAILPAGIATLFAGPGRANIRIAELEVLDALLNNRYPGTVPEGYLRRKKEPIQVFPKLQEAK